MDRGTFVKRVEVALDDLFDPVRLGEGDLGRVLAREEQQLSPERLHRLLVQAIDELRPPAGSPASSPSWRRFQYLNLRYLDGLSHKTTAREIGLSLRQAHRVRIDALAVLADGLWEKYVATSPSRDPDNDVPGHLSSLASAPGVQPTLEDELARLDTEPAGATTDLAREIRAVVDVIRPLADQHGVVVRSDPSPQIPPVTIPRAVLRQALVLVAMCALEHRTTGLLAVSTWSTPEMVLIDTVMTSGTGESIETPKVGDSRLATARRLIETQGGSLEMLNVGSGLCFRLELLPPKIETVLIVDDNPDLARLFDLYLQGTRYHVIRAKTAQSALRLAEKHHPGVVTLDVMMPFQDGWEIFRRLRENPGTESIPIVVCSILPEKELAIALGAADFLPKPVSRESLLATLDRCLDSGSKAS